MRMIAPRLGDAPEYKVVAEEQEEYKPISVAYVTNPNYGSNRPDGLNTCMMAYLPTQEELAALLLGEPIYLHLLTFGAPLQGHILSVGDEVTKAMYGL